MHENLALMQSQLILVDGEKQWHFHWETFVTSRFELKRNGAKIEWMSRDFKYYFRLVRKG